MQVVFLEEHVCLGAARPSSKPKGRLRPLLQADLPSALALVEGNAVANQAIQLGLRLSSHPSLS